MTRIEAVPQKQLRESILLIVRRALDNGNEVIDRTSVLRKVLAKHPIEPSAEAGWYVGWATLGIEALLLKHLHSLRDEENEEERTGQLTLPGHKRLQSHYPVVREKELKIVPLEQLTKSEWARKVTQLRAMAAGLEVHALELEAWGHPRFDPN